MLEIDNPAFQAGHPGSIRRIDAVRSLRDDPLARLHDRRQISEAQYKAGREMQKLLERASNGTIKSQDPSRVVVDGGGIPADFALIRQNEAAKKLEKIKQLIGIDGYDFVTEILLNLRPVANGNTDRDKRHHAWLFRRFLDALATEFGFRTA